MSRVYTFDEDGARRIARAVRVTEASARRGVEPAINYVAPFQLGNLFAVRVAKVGGNAGNSSTQCSFTYDVKDMRNDETLATAVPLTGNGQRIVNATMTEGTWGMAFFDDAGEIKLIWVDERFSQEECT